MNNSDKPANPTHYMQFTNSHGGEDEFYSDNNGLTKREAFAMAAMQGILSNSGGVIQGNNMSGTGWCNSSAESMALWSIECADALLKELEGDK